MRIDEGRELNTPAKMLNIKGYAMLLDWLKRSFMAYHVKK